ncbi:hypothetical protein BDFB_006957, partial [Asbolus verrucosus]
GFRSTIPLDLVLVDDVKLISGIEINAPVSLSDHCTMNVDIQVMKLATPKVENKIFKIVNYNRINTDLQQQDWTYLNRFEFIDSQWNYFLSVIEFLLINTQKSTSLNENYKTAKDPATFLAHRHFSNLLQLEIKNAKYPKIFYGHLRKHLASHVSVPAVQTANVFANFFSSVFTPPSFNAYPTLLFGTPSDTLSDINLAEELLLSKIKNLPLNSTPGPDGVSPRHPYTIDNRSVSEVTLQLDLGVFVDNKLLWSPQCRRAVGKSFAVLHNLKKVFNIRRIYGDLIFLRINIYWNVFNMLYLDDPDDFSHCPILLVSISLIFPFSSLGRIEGT